jgi:[acyl-carrier-protein] S-malonyltransferase
VKTAWLFPGQGAQQPGMGLDLCARSPRAAALLEHAGRVAGGVDVLRVLARGEPAMDSSSFLQPVLTAITLAVAGELAAVGLRPDLVAGHSLGEVAAWSAAGCISAEDAVAAAGLRGRLMERAAEAHPGGMLAIVAGSEAAVAEALACGRAHGEIVLAARNSADQWVLSGDEAALRAVAAAFPALRLPVQGPWHSPAMAGVVEEWLAALLALPRVPGHAGFVANRDGRLVTDAERIPHLLAGQFTHPVAWWETMTTLGEAGVTRVVVVGPGKALRGLLRRHFRERVRLLLTEDGSDLSSTIEVLRS